VKDGSEPRIQLEMALLKATQPQADLSLQALMFRIDQLEQTLGGPTQRQASKAAASASAADSPVPTERQASKAAASAAASPAPTERQASKAAPSPAAPAPAAASSRSASAPSQGAAAVAVDAQPAGAVELEQIVGLWPAIADAVGEQNGMLGAALSAATPLTMDADRLTIAFPADAAFVKKKAEQGRDLVANAVRGMTGQPLTLVFELSDEAMPAAGPATLDHDQLIERLRAEFGAEEVFDQPDEEKD
jgi:DNA polymerase III subunit gamma/tau